MSYNFTYTDPNNVVVTMCVPEREINEMCEYFQRFLSACGYVFENNEKIRCVADKTEDYSYSGCGGDVITFNGDGTPFVYDFGDGYNMPCYGGTRVYGSAGNDTIYL